MLLGATALPQPGEVAHRTNCLVDGGWVGVGGLVGTNLCDPGQWVGGRLFDLMAWDSRWAGWEGLPRKQWRLGLWGMQYMAVGTDAGPTTLAAGQIYDESSRPMLAACWASREVLKEIMLWADRGIASQTDPFRVPCIGGRLVHRGPG